MVFKLIRTDEEDPSKISLPIGINSFGRGVFLDCEDKRVSRRHGQLEVTEDSVTLTAHHHNPCFYKKQSSEETIVLKQDNSASLSNGDQFGLLPTTYWYKLLNCEETEQEDEHQKNTTKDLKNNNQNKGIDSEKVSKMSGVEGNDSELLDFNLNESCVNDPAARSESPSMISTENQEDANEQSSPLKVQLDTSCRRSRTSSRAHSTDDVPAPSRSENASPVARANSPDAQTTSPDARATSPDAGSKSLNMGATSPDARAASPDAGVSSPDIGGESTNARATSPDARAPSLDSLAPSPPPQHRERCWYGSQCYRRNPQHKADFSHPSDPDWASSGACPHGADCRKTDPRHLRDYTHPPKPVKKRRQRKKSSENESDREVSPLLDSPLPAKRKRKTIQRPSLSESGSEEDPYKSDGSDEWQPPSDIKSSEDFSQF